MSRVVGISFLFSLLGMLIFWAGCNPFGYCPTYEPENSPDLTAFFLKGEDGLYFLKVDYFAKGGGIFQNDRCYSDVHIFEVEESGFRAFKHFKIEGKCELNKSYYFNVIYPLSFPSDEYAVTWWKGCMINEPIKYSVDSINEVVIPTRILTGDRFLFDDRGIYRFGKELFYSSYSGDWLKRNKRTNDSCTNENCWELEPISDEVILDCNFPEKAERSEYYIDPVSDVSYYFAFTTDEIDVFRFSVEEVKDKKYECEFPHFVSVKGRFEKVFFTYPFFAGEETSTTNSVDLDLINVETSQKVHYSFTFTTDVIDTNPFKSERIWMLSGLFKFREGILLTFSSGVVDKGYVIPDHFISVWYFENFEDSESVRKIELKYPMGWFSLVRRFGGITQYGDYVYAIGELSSNFILDDVDWYIFSGVNSCKSPWRRSYPVFRGGYNGEKFVWEKIGEVKFNCSLEWW